MADAILELLDPYIDTNASSPTSRSPRSPSTDATTTKYLNRLTSLSLEQLKSTEPQSISQSAHSTLLSLQALSNRSHKALISSSDHLSTLRSLIPSLGQDAKNLQQGIPRLDSEAVRFSTTYSKSGENPHLDRRKKAMQLSRNVDRISDVLELPALLSTAVSTSSATAGNSVSANYSTALDLYSHIKRLQTLYPDSPLIKDIILQAEDAMKTMTTNLIAGLRTQNIRLAAAMRTVGWLRRVAPELENPRRSRGSASSEGALGALFLVCRLANLVSTLEALDPLRELADQETQRRVEAALNERASSKSNAWSGGQQTERFLKRYIEIYREQSFAIVSLYKNIFTPEPIENGQRTPITVPGLDLKSLNLKTQPPAKQIKKTDPLQALPPAVATFPMHLVRLLTDTLRTYLPNVRDRSSRESLLTQVLYCAGSLARLGGDFSMILTEMEDEGQDEEDGETVREWEEIIRKHRALAGRLEQLTSGQAGGASSRSVSQVGSPVH
jgi:conserved oligomeric Golgi complex subunit 8